MQYCPSLNFTLNGIKNVFLYLVHVVAIVMLVISDTYSEPCQTLTMERVAKIVHCFQWLFSKNPPS